MWREEGERERREREGEGREVFLFSFKGMVAGASRPEGNGAAGGGGVSGREGAGSSSKMQQQAVYHQILFKTLFGQNVPCHIHIHGLSECVVLMGSVGV